jgi:hypothetical protein
LNTKERWTSRSANLQVQRRERKIREKSVSADEEELTDFPTDLPTDSSDAKPAGSSHDNSKAPHVASSSTVDTKERWNARSANLEVKRRERQSRSKSVCR